jgi:hypothetical protein
MKTDFYPIYMDPFTVFDSTGIDQSEPVTHHRDAVVVGQVMAHSGPGMISVGVGNQRFIDRSPWVDVHIGLWAVQSNIGKIDQCHGLNNKCPDT